MNTSDFIKGVERLIDPIEVGTLHFMQSFNNMMPKGLQKKMVEASGKKMPYMGFVVEPYSYFLCYEVADLDKAKQLLPDGFSLIKTHIFADDEPKYYGIIGCFNAHTNGFWGLRVECYLIAQDDKTGLLSWIILDYDTNTITYDPKTQLSDPNASHSIITVDFNGDVHVDVTNNQGRKINFVSNISQGVFKPLNQRLWVEGNLSIGYSRLKNLEGTPPFSLIFNPLEFEKALQISKTHLNLVENNWFPGLFKTVPSELVCFPYAQHFLSDSPGHATEINNQDELIEQIERVDFSKIEVFSTKSFKSVFLLGGLMALTSNAILLFLLFSR